MNNALGATLLCAHRLSPEKLKVDSQSSLSRKTAPYKAPSLEGGPVPTQPEGWLPPHGLRGLAWKWDGHYLLKRVVISLTVVLL